MTLPPDQRESFFQAQARQRRRAARIGVFASLAGVVLASLVALLTAPVILIALALAFDVIHLITPMPNLFALGARAIEALSSEAGVSVGAWLAGLTLAAAPGLMALLLAWRSLRALAERCLDAALTDQLQLRAPRRDELEELQLVNVIEEMALAARLPTPSVSLIDTAMVNLGAFELGGQTRIVVTRGLLDTLDRAQTQALLGHLLAHIGNGDIALGARLLRVHELCGLLKLLSQAPLDRRARASLRALWRARRGDDAQAALVVRDCLLDPAAHSDLASTRREGPPHWREYLSLPLFGAMMAGILIVPIGRMLLLAAPLALIGRSRRLLADAMAVQFTRDPTALASALSLPALAHTALPGLPAALASGFVLPTGDEGMAHLVSPHPSLAKRVDALRRQGASIEALDAPHHGRTRSMTMLAIAVPLVALVAALMALVIYLGVVVAMALSLLFLALPAGLVHFILRAIAG